MTTDHQAEPKGLSAEEEAHCICPVKEAHAGMDEMGAYLDARVSPTASRAPARVQPGEEA